MNLPRPCTSRIEAISSTPTSQLSTLQIGLGTSSRDAGGAERVFGELAAHLPACGVAFNGAVAEVQSSASANNASRYSFASEGSGTRARIIGARRTLSRVLESEKIDLVASHFALYSFPILDRVRRVPFVVHFHGPWSIESAIEGSDRIAAYLKHQIERLVYRSADRVITLSNAFADLVHDTYGVQRMRIHVIPGSVDLDHFGVSLSKAEARKELGWPLSRRILVSVRRLSHRMGLDLLIDAMPDVVAKNPEVLLYIGGKGPLRDALEQRVSALRLSRYVQFLGFVPEDRLPLVYRAADFNVVPTRACEGFGLVAAESLAAGTPSIVTPIGGLPEIVTPFSPDLVLRSHSTKDIAEGLIRALSGDISIPSSDECSDYAKTNFSSSLMASRTATLYRELLG